MQVQLSQLSAVPEVIGCLVCDQEGQLLAHAFPPTFEAARLQGLAATVADRTAGLETALGSVGAVDLRFANARLVVKAVQGARLLLVCTPAVNLELLNMAASGVVRSLARAAAEAAASPATPSPAAEPAAAVEPQAAGQLYQAVQRVNVLIERSGKDPFKLRGQVALKAGFALDLVSPETPDDPAALQKLRAAALAILGQPV